MDFPSKIHFLGKAAGLQPIDYPADLFRSVGPDMSHIGLDDLETEMVNHGIQFPIAFLVRGDLGADITQVLRWISSWKSPASK